MPAMQGDRRFKGRTCQTPVSHGVRDSHDCLTGVETEAQRGAFMCSVSHSSAFTPRTLCLPHPCVFLSAPQLGSFHLKSKRFRGEGKVSPF